jgi:hypothetical protein
LFGEENMNETGWNRFCLAKRLREGKILVKNNSTLRWDGVFELSVFGGAGYCDAEYEELTWREVLVALKKGGWRWV